MSSAPGNLADRMQIAQVFAPVVMGTATNAGDWVAMNQYGALHVIVVAGPATATDVSPFVVFEQATSVTGGSAKALNVVRYLTKRATSVQDVAQFTVRTQSATNGAPLGSSTGTVTEGNFESIGVFSFSAEDLDVTNGFDCVRATVNKTGTSAMVGTAIYIGEGARYTAPPSMLS